jgi:hypothetical protein
MDKALPDALVTGYESLIDSIELPGQSSAEEFSTFVHELAHLCCVASYVA